MTYRRKNKDFRQVSMTAEEIELVLKGVHLIKGGLSAAESDYIQFIEKFTARLRRHLATLKRGTPSVSWPPKPDTTHDIREDY